MTDHVFQSAQSVSHSWRQDAARIVEELFRVAPVETWDLLLDLRQNLLHGKDWNHTLDIFLACREHLELAQYLPFYRLRNLLANSLKLEASDKRSQPGSLRRILQRKHRSLAEIDRHLVRELFEHDLEVPMDHSLGLQVVER